MRRNDLELTDRADVEAVISAAQVCRLAMCEGDRPYLVPLSFGYRDNALYFHCATEGRKLDILARNNRVCFEMETGVELRRADAPCDFGMSFSSVLGFGAATIVDDPEDKSDALDIILEHYGGTPGEYPEDFLNIMKVIRVDIESMTGKKSG